MVMDVKTRTTFEVKMNLASMLMSMNDVLSVYLLENSVERKMKRLEVNERSELSIHEFCWTVMRHIRILGLFCKKPGIEVPWITSSVKYTIVLRKVLGWMCSFFRDWLRIVSIRVTNMADVYSRENICQLSDPTGHFTGIKNRQGFE